MTFKLKALFFPLFLIFSSFSQADEKCLRLFRGSLRQAQDIVSSKSFNYLPQFKNMSEEIELSKHWSRKETLGMKTLTSFLPKYASFIDHPLRESASKTVVKFQEKGDSMIVRASYKSQGKILETNVTLSSIGLINNPYQNKKWLINPHVSAGILFLHGGGTKSTGGHVAHSLINHFKKHNVAVLSPDLPWHGEGPRAIMGNLDKEMMALSDFVKEYIHPKVPVFVWGHSWGGSFAHRIMQMTGEQKKGFFHDNLKGLIITSPAVDPAPGKAIKEKKKAYIKRREAVLNEKEHLIAPYDKDIFTSMVLDGKTSPVGEFFSSLTISQLNDQLPKHKGKEYLPALMVVGNGDPLVYVGYEDLFHNYYDNLENVETHYLERLPLLKNPNQKEKVGHLLGDYLAEPQDTAPVNFKLSADFITKLIPELKPNQAKKDSPLLTVLKLYSNDLAFREWLETAVIIDIRNNGLIMRKLHEEKTQTFRKVEELILNFHPSTWLLRSLQKALSDNAQKAEIDITTYKKHFGKFKRFVTHVSYSKFLTEIETAENLTELKPAIKKLLSQKILPPELGERAKKLFFNEALSFSEADNLDAFFINYFYIPKPEQKEIKSLFQKIKDIEDKLQEAYIPSPEDFKDLVSETKIKDKIRKIKFYVKKRKALQEKEYELKREIKKIHQEINKNITTISKYMRQVRDTFESANLSPPKNLEKDYLESQEEFLKLYEFSQGLSDEIEAEAVKAIENEDFTIDTLKNATNKHQDKINEFHHMYSDFILNRKKIRQKLIQSVMNGDLTEKQADIFNSLYGALGVYKRTDTLSLELAEKEAELVKVSQNKASYLEAYQQHSPFPALSVVSVKAAKDILNNTFIEDYENKEDKAFQEILKSWKSLGSLILPPLPE